MPSLADERVENGVENDESEWNESLEYNQVGEWNVGEGPGGEREGQQETQESQTQEEEVFVG